LFTLQNSGDGEQKKKKKKRKKEADLVTLVAHGASGDGVVIGWTAVVSGGSPSSLCFFFLPLFFCYLCRQCFFPLYSGFVVVLLVAMVVE
jgi:hypothetical protein